MKRGLALAALGLMATAFVGSFTHVRETVAQHGQGGWISWAIALMPEVSVGLCILKARQGHGNAWVWVTGVTAAGFTLMANLAQAEMSPWGLVVAAWPAWASIGAAGMIELTPEKGHGSKAKGQGHGVKPQVSAPVTQIMTPPEPRVSLHAVTQADPDDLGHWVRVQRADGVKRAEVIREGVTRFGVSESTVKRRWDEAREGAA